MRRPSRLCLTEEVEFCLAEGQGRLLKLFWRLRKELKSRNEHKASGQRRRNHLLAALKQPRFGRHNEEKIPIVVASLVVDAT